MTLMALNALKIRYLKAFVSKLIHKTDSGGRCYDHYFCYFWQFSAKKWRFLKNNILIKFFSQFSLVLSKNRQIFCPNFRRKFLKKS
jgi:hypothetical protein